MKKCRKIHVFTIKMYHYKLCIGLAMTHGLFLYRLIENKMYTTKDKTACMLNPSTESQNDPNSNQYNNNNGTSYV